MERPDFQQFFDTTLRARLEAMEGARGELKNRALVVLAAAVGAAILGGMFLSPLFNGHPAAWLLPGAIVGGALGFMWFYPGWREYVDRFKSEIVAEIVRFISPALRYAPGSRIPQETYMRSGIFPRHPDRFSGEDMVEGTIGVTPLRFSELHSQYKTETRDSKGRRRTQWHTIFKGLFFQADFNKHFSGRTFVLTDVAEKWLGSWGQSLQGSHGSAELVKLEDPVFEKEFVVHGTDQIEARYILSPALMSRIVEFKKKARRDVQLSFIDASVYVAIPYTEDLFEPRLFRTGVDLSQIQGYYEALSLTISIVEELNLNTRIWTKV